MGQYVIETAAQGISGGLRVTASSRDAALMLYGAYLAHHKGPEFTSAPLWMPVVEVTLLNDNDLSAGHVTRGGGLPYFCGVLPCGSAHAHGGAAR